MKRIFATILAVAACAVISFGQASPPTNVNTLVSFRGGSVSQVVSHRIGIAHNAFSVRGLDIDVRGFGGLNFTAGNAVTSGIILAPVTGWSLAREITLTPLVFGAATQGRSIDFGVGVELTFRFGT